MSPTDRLRQHERLARLFDPGSFEEADKLVTFDHKPNKPRDAAAYSGRSAVVGQK